MIHTENSFQKSSKSAKGTTSLTYMAFFILDLKIGKTAKRYRMIHTMNFWEKNVQNQGKVPHDSYHDFRGKKVQNQGKVPHDSDTKISLKNLQNREKVPHDSDTKISLKNLQNREKVPHPQ